MFNSLFKWKIPGKNSFYLKHPSITLKHLIAYPFILMLIAGTIIPSDGNHGILNVKSLSFFLTALGLAFYLFAKKTMAIRYLKTLGFLVASLIFLIGWSAIGLLIGQIEPAMSFDQLKIFLITICTVIFSYYYVNERIVPFSRFLKILVYTNAVYSAIKVAMVILHFTNVIHIFTLMEKTGLRFMSMDIGTGMIRMQTSLDILTPFLVFFVLESSRLQVSFNPWFKRFYYCLSAFSLLLSFSRVLMFIGVVGWALYSLSGSVSRLNRSIAILILAMGMIVQVVGVEKIGKVIEKRFFSNENRQSDETRSDQIQALFKEYETSPYLGKGMGGYSPELVRDGKVMHSYEVQWVAFLMQFGLLGILLILAALTIIMSRYLKAPFSRFRFSCLVMFGCWLLAGFTNPYLISLTSGIIYALFLLSGSRASGSDLLEYAGTGAGTKTKCL